MRRLIIGLICLLFVIQTVSAENRVTNGDFETGDLTGWTSGGNRSYTIEVGTSYAYSGNYGCKLVAEATSDGSSDAWIKQEVDLTDVETLEFYYKIADADGVGLHAFGVFIDSDKVFEDKGGGAGGWKNGSVDVSGYEGVHTIKFKVAGIKSGLDLGYVEVYLDDVVAEGLEFYNVTFYFIDDSTGEYLQGVWLNYSINGELYNATFNSGDKIVVENESTIEIYEAEKYGFVSELEEGGYCLFYTITNDTTIEIHFHPAEGEWHYVELYFQDAETGSLLDNVHLTAKIEYQGETQIIDGIYDYHKTIWVLENSTVLITKAEREGYESELEKEGISLVFIDIQENITYYIKFYEISSEDIYANLHFYFFDSKKNALIPGVNFTLNCEGNVIDSGTYDYEKEYIVERWKTYSWLATKTGYFNASGEIEIGADQDTYTVYVELVPIETPPDTNYTTVSFLVNRSDGYPVSGAVVTLEDISKITNQQGYAYFEVAKNGTYSYIVSAEGYESISGTVEVGTDPVLVEVTLQAMVAPTPTPTSGDSTPSPTSTPGTGTYQPSPSQEQSLSIAIDALYTNAPTLVNLAILVAIMSFLGMITRTLPGGRRRR